MENFYVIFFISDKTGNRTSAAFKINIYRPKGTGLRKYFARVMVHKWVLYLEYRNDWAETGP